MQNRQIQQQPKNSRYLARRVVCDGQEYFLSLVEIVNGRVNISPFTEETHSTTYVDGTIRISTDNGKLVHFEIN